MDSPVFTFEYDDSGYVGSITELVVWFYYYVRNLCYNTLKTTKKQYKTVILAK
jgi:hypothetical protein